MQNKKKCSACDGCGITKATRNKRFWQKSSYYISRRIHSFFLLKRRSGGRRRSTETEQVGLKIGNVPPVCMFVCTEAKVHTVFYSPGQFRVPSNVRVDPVILCATFIIPQREIYTSLLQLFPTPFLSLCWRGNQTPSFLFLFLPVAMSRKQLCDQDAAQTPRFSKEGYLLDAPPHLTEVMSRKHEDLTQPTQTQRRLGFLSREQNGFPVPNVQLNADSHRRIVIFVRD